MPHFRFSIRFIVVTMLLLVAVACLPTRASAQARLSIKPDNITELFAYLDSCLKYIPGSEESEMTLRFSLTHTGELRGPPLVNYSSLKGSEDVQKAFRAMTLDALNACEPVPMTEHFGKIASTKLILWKARALVAPPRAR